LIDRATEQNFFVALAIEPSVVPDRIRVALECDPIPAGRTWKVSLRDAGEELARIPILQRWEALDTKLPYGFYVVELLGDEHSLCRFAFTVEPFSLPEALDAAEEYLAHSQYSRAVAVLEDAGARYPTNGEVWDLLSVVEELAALDPEAIAREGEQFGVFRGPLEWFKGAGTVLQKMRSQFGESVASLLVARKLEPASVSDAVLGSATELPVSLPALRALVVLEQRLREAGEGAQHRDERLEQILTGVTGRLGQLETLTLDLGERLDAIRTEKDRDVEEKFSLVGEQLVQFSKGTRSLGVSLPDFAPVFQETLGEGCWKWIGDDTQEMFVSAEDIYRYFAGSATMRTRDFSPALIEFCRGLELLLNFRLGKLCEAIRNLVSGNQVLRDFVEREVKSWAKLKETIEFKKSYTIPQVAISLRLGKAMEQRYPELIGTNVASLLTSSGLSDHQSICVLSHIGQIFRNGKVHPYPGSERMFTTPAEVQVLRKLLFGLDEERVDSGAFFSEFYKLQGFTKGEIHAAANSLFQTWPRFPGLIPKIWRTAEGDGALKAAS
jgi:hypothetical protein